MTDRVYLVVCGATRVTIDELVDEAIALDVCARHEAVHGCKAWVQYPLEHEAPTP